MGETGTAARVVDMGEDTTGKRVGYGEIRDPDTIEFIRRWGAASHLTEDIPWTGDTRSVHIGHPMWVEDSDSIAFSYRGWRLDFEYHQSVPRRSRWRISDPSGDHVILNSNHYRTNTDPVNVCVLLRMANWMAHHGWAPGWEDHVVPAT